MEVIKVNKIFDNRIGVLKMFGFVGKGLRHATWRIPETNRYVWIATEGSYHGGENILTNEGRTFMDRRDPKATGWNTYGVHSDQDVERLLFLNTMVYRQPVIKFAGVFKPDMSSSVLNVAAWKRISDECSLPDGAWIIPKVSDQ